ncbi:hypothetical protein HHI36_024090 [Cryptolaemus montrouzieri]|uniref:Uncharacterized protein n=1 Tax=Cryptolaemus montrouzieri TaxID=559131 RepID=A0ABD2N0K8_9CUCU
METEIGNYMLKHWNNCDNTTRCLEDVYENPNKAISIEKKYIDYLLMSGKEDGVSPIYCVGPEIISYPIVMIMRKTLSTHEKIDALIGRITASGLIDKWLSFYNGTTNEFFKPEESGKMLKFTNLKPMFLSMGIGNVLLCFIFVMELIYNHFIPS